MATQALELPSSADLMCDNIMCEKVRYLPCGRLVRSCPETTTASEDAGALSSRCSARASAS
jgi:hypothetical protein